MKKVKAADKKEFARKKTQLQKLEKEKGLLMQDLERLAKAVCPWERGDVVTSPSNRKGAPFRIEAVCFNAGKTGYSLHGHYANDSNTAWSSSRHVLGGWCGSVTDLSLSKATFLRPRHIRLAEALERVAKGEKLEDVKKDLSL